MDGVLPKSQLSTCFESKANAKANRSIKANPITLWPVSTTKAKKKKNCSAQPKYLGNGNSNLKAGNKITKKGRKQNGNDPIFVAK